MECTEFGGSPPPTVCVRVCTHVCAGRDIRCSAFELCPIPLGQSLTDQEHPILSARLAGPRAQVILQSPHPITGLAGVQVDSSLYMDVEDLNPGHHA